jgi:hypothetical protein
VRLQGKSDNSNVWGHTPTLWWSNPTCGERTTRRGPLMVLRRGKRANARHASCQDARSVNRHCHEEDKTHLQAGARCMRHMRSTLQAGVPTGSTLYRKRDRAHLQAGARCALEVHSTGKCANARHVLRSIRRAQGRISLTNAGEDRRSRPQPTIPPEIVS